MDGASEIMHHFSRYLTAVALTIIASTAAIGETTRSGMTQSMLRGFKLALEEYKADIGSYPSTSMGLYALIEKPKNINNWRGPYIPKLRAVIDPWGNKLRYNHPPLYNNSEYELYSVGPNGVDEHSYGDDIKLQLR